jgi:dipeptidase
MTDNENRIRIYKYKDTNLHNIYCDLDKDEFYVKKNEKTNYFTPIRWKHVFRNYRNKKDDTDKQKTYHYIHFYNPETKQKKIITEKDWLNNKEEVIKYNKEEVEKHLILEIWKHILEFIANHKITEKLFYPNSTEYNSENNSENNL